MIDKPYIMSSKFRRKFNNATSNQKLNKALYNAAKEMLFDRSGTNFESMYWFDGLTGDIIAKFDAMGRLPAYSGVSNEFKIIYDKRISSKLFGYDNIVTLHNHPNSTAPSPGDLNSAYLHSYNDGFTVSHNGGLYRYTCKELVNEHMFDRYMSKFLSENCEWNEAQIRSYEKLSVNQQINVMEITDEIPN
jgi:hypothetical protein